MDTIQQEIKEYLDERKWNNLLPGDLSKSISIEAAELLEHFQWSNPSFENLEEDTDRVVKVRKEIADIMIYAIQFCAFLDVDYQDVVREKLELARLKYPVEKVLDNRDLYHEIKEAYRREGKN